MERKDPRTVFQPDTLGKLAEVIKADPSFFEKNSRRLDEAIARNPELVGLVDEG